MSDDTPETPRPRLKLRSQPEPTTPEGSNASPTEKPTEREIPPQLPASTDSKEALSSPSDAVAPPPIPSSVDQPPAASPPPLSANDSAPPPIPKVTAQAAPVESAPTPPPVPSASTANPTASGLSLNQPIEQPQEAASAPAPAPTTQKKGIGGASRFCSSYSLFVVEPLTAFGQYSAHPARKPTWRHLRKYRNPLWQRIIQSSRPRPRSHRFQRSPMRASWRKQMGASLRRQ